MGCRVRSNPFIKLAVGAIMLGVGFVVSMQAQRELIAKWAAPCEDCDDEAEVRPDAVLVDLEDVASFVEAEDTMEGEGA